MTRGYERTGIIALENLEGMVPTRERLGRGPVAIVECPQEIPCDPCVHACPFKAISMERIIDPPKIDFDECTGCALCARKCPGLAIFIVDMANSPKGKAWVTIPYEFLPIPKAGDVVRALNREGKDIGAAKIIRVVPMSKGEKSVLITLEVEEGLAMEARALRC